ncbi:2OG-Fe(II) oxygenase [Novispirillum sp. DQ9]|uniref:2OG-Fe(II) oxygenase n=1 Tax=Novispirillum sp. DQ9 TaxID=3398612 RepID=UPI003C7C4B86
MDDQISLARRAMLHSPLVLSQFRAGAEARLRVAPEDPAGLWRLAQLCRALGDFDAAAQSYDAYARVRPGDPLGTALARLMRGDPDGMVGLAGPSPFLRIEHFLNDADHAALWARVAACAAHLRPSRVYGEEGADLKDKDQSRVDPVRRVSMLALADAGLRAFLLPKLEAVMAVLGLPGRFGLPDLHGGRVEMQVTSHLDRGFFSLHRDTGPATPDRTLTFVYYLARFPVRYSGGDLLLHDEEEGNANGNFTRIAPVNNSLVLFPSGRLHEVLPITCDSADPLDGRITINGWFHNKGW